ncbi:hypothetical protein PPACK8108_LOCUS13764, partial [Phakopsora pachyrhizi]
LTQKHMLKWKTELVWASNQSDPHSISFYAVMPHNIGYRTSTWFYTLKKRGGWRRVTAALYGVSRN